MQTISLNELENNLVSYFETVKNGNEIIIKENNQIIARILPFADDEEVLVNNGLMSLPKKQLPADFWDSLMPEVSFEKITETIRDERDED